MRITDYLRAAIYISLSIIYEWDITSRASIIFSHAGVFCLCFAFCVCSSTLFTFRSPTASLTSITIICILYFNISKELDWNILPRLILTEVIWGDLIYLWDLQSLWNTPCYVTDPKPLSLRHTQTWTKQKGDYDKSTPIIFLSFFSIKSWQYKQII